MKKQERKKIESFEDLFVYQKAREFSRKIAALVKRLPADEKNKLKDQMTRARRSITNNIAEGYGRFHYQENIQYCRQSRGSICEIIDDLIECRDENYIEGNEFNSLREDGYSLIKIVNKYIAYLQRAKQESGNTS